jgi:hypothetical protein
MSLRGCLETRAESKEHDLQMRLKVNKWNIASLTCTAVCLQDRTLKTWMEADSIRVDEILELLNQLPEERQPPDRKENFKLMPTELRPGECPLEDMPPAVETEEVLESHAAIDRLYPVGYPEECKGVLKYKKPCRSKD